MRAAVYVALAGGLGSLGRYLVGRGLERLSPGHLPYGTLAVNVTGSFLLGLTMVVFATRGELDSNLRLALTVGFLGGFTTYSAFAFETVALLQQRQVAVAATYALATLFLAGLGCLAGMMVGRALR